MWRRSTEQSVRHLLTLIFRIGNTEDEKHKDCFLMGCWLPLALIVSYVESLVPMPVPVPGIQA